MTSNARLLGTAAAPLGASSDRHLHEPRVADRGDGLDELPGGMPDRLPPGRVGGAPRLLRVDPPSGRPSDRPRRGPCEPHRAARAEPGLPAHRPRRARHLDPRRVGADPRRGRRARADSGLLREHHARASSSRSSSCTRARRRRSAGSRARSRTTSTTTSPPSAATPTSSSSRSRTRRTSTATHARSSRRRTGRRS